MKIIKRITAVLFSMLAIVLLMPVQVPASEGMDPDQEISLIISCNDENWPLTGVQFDIYLVAAVDKYGEMTVADAFSEDYKKEELLELDEEGWRELAFTLEGYILQNQITPTDSGETDTEGRLVFPSDPDRKLTAGLYLVLGQHHIQDRYVYDAAGSILLLTGPENEINPKFEVTEQPDTVTRKVLKVWKDSGHEQERPKEITVQLFRDNDIYDTVTLNADNNWRYTWENLDGGCKWTVAEKKPEAYKVTVTKEGITFVVTNTYTEGTPSGPSGSTGSKLPQTGQLWWPVPFLAAAGLLLIVIGLFLGRGAKNEK